MVNVLIIGQGGREHAIASALVKSQNLGQLFAFPGNAGIAEIAKIPDLKDSNDFDSIASFCRNQKIDLVVIGPEQPLVDGLADFLEHEKIAVFGCVSKAAQLESSKSFTKDLCKSKGIKTAEYKVCFTEQESLDYLESNNKYPIVIKADGLAAGKGVVIAMSAHEADQAIKEIFSGKYSKQSKVVIEEFLEGVEASFFAVSDGKTVRSFGTAGDHKKIGEGETGANTGGMGTYSPSPFVTDEDAILEQFITPTIEYLNEQNIVFKGVLFLGLMLTKDGPYLLEYNVRFGDPETQSILMRLDCDFLDVVLSVANGSLADCEIKFKTDKAITVVLAAKGYPEEYRKNTIISGVGNVSADKNNFVFHAGTKKDGDKLLANGGRVLNVTSIASSYKEAYDKVYSAIEKISWEDCYYRRDIGAKILQDK